MNEKNAKRRGQREFFFVLKGAKGNITPSSLLVSDGKKAEQKKSSADVLDIHRERLLAELMEFGC